MSSNLLNLGCGSRYHLYWINIDSHSNTPDVIAHDLTQRLPFADKFADVVYHSHVLEHLSKSFASVFLHECYRVLKPGGIIRVVVPDLEQIVRAYLELLERSLQGDEIAQKRYDWIMLEMLDQMVRSRSGGEMLKYWQQNPMPAEEFVIERVGSEVVNVIKALRNSPTDHVSARGQDEPAEPGKIGEFRMSGEVHQWMYDRYSLRCLLKEAGFVEITQCRADVSSIPNFNSYLLDIEKDGTVRKPDSLFMEAVKPI